MNTLQLSALLFGIAALGGLTMVGIRLSRNANPPMWLAMLHGVGAAAGITLLAWTAWKVGVDTYAQASLALFLLAAAGGAFLNLRFHQRGITLPVGLILAHAVVAVTAFGLLLMSLFAPA